MLNFFAPINNLGYGVFSHGLIKAYDRYVSQDIALFAVPQADFTDESINRWMANGARFSKSDPSIMIFQAPWLNRFTGKPMIGFPIFELDIVPDYDLSILKGLDVALQPSEWGKKVLVDHGVRQVHVVPGGYDPEIFQSRITLDQKLARIEQNGVTFVHVGKFEVRKSSEEILHCFLRATKGCVSKVNFVFHVCNPFDPQWFPKVEKILKDYGFAQTGTQFSLGSVRVIVPQGRFTNDPSKLYETADFGIWASKAEGWNLPLLECLACGTPCLTTDNTAQADFIRKGIYPAELVLKSQQKEPTRLGGMFWPLDHEELISKIKNLIQDPKKYLQMSERCLESVKPFTWENAAKKLEQVLTIVLRKN
jgi:glycosyltransferase involved in cell wall biosynthesis